MRFHEREIDVEKNIYLTLFGKFKIQEIVFLCSGVVACIYNFGNKERQSESIYIYTKIASKVPLCEKGNRAQT